MNLGTIGLIFKFAIELEDKNFKLVKMFQEVEYQEELSKQYSKRIKRLKRLRRENTTEMILEPIHDFDSTKYELEDEEMVSSALSLRDKILFNEVVLRSFYEDASEKTFFLSEVSNIFREFISEHQENIEKIEKS